MKACGGGGGESQERVLSFDMCRHSCQTHNLLTGRLSMKVTHVHNVRITGSTTVPPAVHPPAVPAAPVHRPVLQVVPPAGVHAAVQLHTALLGLWQSRGAHSPACCLQRHTPRQTQSGKNTNTHYNCPVAWPAPDPILSLLAATLMKHTYVMEF
jgi:hypothetical protein